MTAGRINQPYIVEAEIYRFLYSTGRRCVVDQTRIARRRRERRARGRLEDSRLRTFRNPNSAVNRTTIGATFD
uniref:Transposase n=1 Tax=Globodera pallida TaxID=36090 RepID=A0A183BPM0_GLOPA